MRHSFFCSFSRKSSILYIFFVLRTIKQCFR